MNLLVALLFLLSISIPRPLQAASRRCLHGFNGETKVITIARRNNGALRWWFVSFIQQMKDGADFFMFQMRPLLFTSASRSRGV